MAISIADVRAVFTKTLIDVYQERPKVTNFLAQFFPTKTAPTKTISIEVERGFEKVAVDVVRGTEGNRNTFSRSTEKIFEPPLWREYFDATQLDLYDRVLGSQGNAQKPLFTALMNSVSDRLGMLQDKIERAKELQRVQVLTTGIVTLVNGTNIDFKRKATSIVDLAAPPANMGYPTGYWSANSDPFKTLTAVGNFMRSVGKSGDGTFNLICGSDALSALLVNTVFTARQNYFNMALDNIIVPVRNAVGAIYTGTLTAGAYKFQLWAYPQFYDDPTTGVSTPYIPGNLVIAIPSSPRFVHAHAAVPQLIGEPGQLPTQGEYVVGEFLDPRKATHDFDIQSAAVPIPVAIDTIVTVKVI